MEPPRPPNVLVVMTDQQKATASNLFTHGFDHGVTPAMARLAEAGTLYDAAFTPHPLCVPARCAFWCSQYAHTTGCRRNETLLPPGVRPPPAPPSSSNCITPISLSSSALLTRPGAAGRPRTR